MDAKLRRKLIVSGVGVVVVIAFIVGLYLLLLKPYVKSWREARDEIRKREDRLNELRTAFANQRNPEDELKVLQEEVVNLTKANEELQKLKTAGVERKNLPRELDDKDPEIRKELYRDYMKQVMEAAKNKVKDKLKSAQISPPDIDLFTDLKDADEVAYYMNRAAGLQGIVDALTKSRTSDGTLVFDKLTLEDFGPGMKRRQGAVNILNYQLKLTMDTQTLMSFLYNLREEPSYYFIESLEITPRSAVGGKKQQLSVDAKVDTTMVFQSQVQAQARAAAAKAATVGKPGARISGGGGWMGQMAAAMKKQQEEEAHKAKEKKWYQFWKK
jgi:hypothetical protein